MTDHPLDPHHHGRAHHAFIARLAREGKLDLDPFELAVEAAEEVRCGYEPIHRVPKYRQAWRRGLQRSANTYSFWFAPRDGERLLSTEMAVANVRYDLVWRRAAGGVWADELKIGRPPRVFDGLDEQLDAEIVAGIGEWGEQFLGVRAVLLAAPARSFVVFPDGSREDVVFDVPDDEERRDAD